VIDVIANKSVNPGNGGGTAATNGHGAGNSPDRVTLALGSIFMGITCSVCGSDKVIRAGACGVCIECGTSQGCS
jgi:ribonucleoside-diphosphate reductase alpha chain